MANKPPTQEPATAPAPTAPETIEQNGQKFALVATVKTAATNREFQTNVQVVQRQRETALHISRCIELVRRPETKDALRKELTEFEKSLNENNALMVKTYGFSLARNYLIRFLKTKLYTPLTDEEFEKVSPEDKAKPDAIKTIDGKVFLYIAAIDGIEANDLFRQNVQIVQNQRNRLIQIKQFLDTKGIPETERAKAKEDFDKSEETLKKNNEEMVKLYGFSLMRNYQLEVEESQLYIALTPEEVEKSAAAPAAAN